MKVNINIKTTQYNDAGETNEIKVKSTGDLYEKKGHKYIIYKELEDNKETTTSLKIESDKVTITRFGDLDSVLTFKKGHKDISRYRTQEGMFVIENTTNLLDIQDNDKITIDIDYNIEIMNIFRGRNIINIEINKADK